MVTVDHKSDVTQQAGVLVKDSQGCEVTGTEKRTYFLTSALQRGSPTTYSRGMGLQLPWCQRRENQGLGHWSPVVKTLSELLLCMEVCGDQD